MFVRPTSQASGKAMAVPSTIVAKDATRVFFRASRFIG